MDTDIRFETTTPAMTEAGAPDFPVARFDTGRLVYQEALVDGQLLMANASAMGRPKPRESIWREFHGGAFAPRPQRGRQHAFHLEIDGQLLADRWGWVEGREEPSGRPGCRDAVAVVRHRLRPIRVEVRTRIAGAPVLSRWLVVTNEGERSAAVARVCPWAGQLWQPVGHPWITTPLPALGRQPFTLGRFTDSTAGAEGTFAWMPLPDGIHAFEALEGRSGWGMPFCVVRNEATGELVVAHLAWSGNWRIELCSDHEPSRQPVSDARLYARLGLAGPAPVRVLEPGESATTPAAHLGFLFGGLDEAVQAMHEHLRRSVLLPHPPGREHRVEVNHTGFTRNLQVTERQLLEEIEVAADVGVELFMLDAGWFGGEQARWHEVVGDWDRESPLLPHGVKGVFDHARQRGLLCGLWVEAERMGPASQALREHPDWQMQRRGERLPNLDLARPEVARYLEQTIVGLVERYRLDCFRLDYNISVGEGGESEHGGWAECGQWRYVEALYGIFERLRQRFPDLLLENCSSGGGRADSGIMGRFHWTQVTDKWSPGPTLKIVNGMTLALPPELCMTLLGAITDGVADLDFMLRIGLFGHFCASGIFPTMAERHTEARRRWIHAIELYKRFVRPVLGEARVYHHTPVGSQTAAGDWVVLEMASRDRHRGWAGVFGLEQAAGAYPFVPRGLDPGRSYRVQYDNHRSCRTVDGGILTDQGLRVPVPGPFTSELLLFEAI